MLIHLLFRLTLSHGKEHSETSRFCMFFLHWEDFSALSIWKPGLVWILHDNRLLLPKSLNTMLRKWSLLLQKRTVLLWMIISLDADHAVESVQCNNVDIPSNKPQTMQSEGKEESIWESTGRTHLLNFKSSQHRLKTSKHLVSTTFPPP